MGNGKQARSKAATQVEEDTILKKELANIDMKLDVTKNYASYS